jgi:hypothetical protein
MHKTACGDASPPVTPLIFEEFLKMLKLKTVEASTASRWLKVLRFKYCEQKKPYFSDHHDHPKNIEARKAFGKKYFELERRAHRWV